MHTMYARNVCAQSMRTIYAHNICTQCFMRWQRSRGNISTFSPVRIHALLCLGNEKPPNNNLLWRSEARLTVPCQVLSRKRSVRYSIRCCIPYSTVLYLAHICNYFKKIQRARPGRGAPPTGKTANCQASGTMITDSKGGDGVVPHIASRALSQRERNPGQLPSWIKVLCCLFFLL